MMTIKLFWEHPYKKTFNAQVIEILKEGIVLDKTIFHPEGGNQESDIGYLEKNGEKVKVTEVSYSNKKIVHHISPNFAKKLKVGDAIKGKIDWEHRYGIMKSHTSQHIFSAILKNKFNINTERAKIRSNHVVLKLKEKIQFPVLEQALKIVNEIFTIKNDIITQRILSSEEIKNLESKVRGEMPEKDSIRLILTEDYDITCCSGTHVKKSNEIGPIFIYEFKKNKKIKYYTGNEAIKNIVKYNIEFLKMAEKMHIPLDQVMDRTEKRFNDIDKLVERNEFLARKTLELLGKNPDIEKKGIKIAIVSFPIDDRLLNEIFDRFPENSLLIFKLNDQILKLISNSEEINAAHLLDVILERFGGRGGGSPHKAQGKLDKMPKNILKEIEQLI